MKLQTKKRTRVRLEENHRLGRIKEHSHGENKFLVLERANADGSITELDQMVDPMDQAESKLDFIDLEKTPLTEATVLGKTVNVPDGVLGILQFELMIQADVATRNNTLYTFADTKREFGAYNKNAVKANKAWGGFKHPSFWADDYRIEFDNAAVRWFMMNFDKETGVISGAGYLLDKKEGLDIRAGLRSGGVVGVSSRGWGYAEKFSEYEGIHGLVEDVWVIEDWILEGFDIVTDNSAIGAETDQFFTESAKRRAGKKTEAKEPKPKPVPAQPSNPIEETDTMTLEEFKAKHPVLYKGVLAEGVRDGRVEASADFERAAPKRREAIVAELTEGDTSKLVPRADFAAAQIMVKESAAKVDALTAERDAALASQEALTVERDEFKSKVESAEAEAEKAKVKAIVSSVLSTHTHKAAIESRLTDADLATEATAKAAIEREIEWLFENFNVPKSPVSSKQLERIGKPDNKHEDNPAPAVVTPGSTLMEKSKRVGAGPIAN